MITTAGNGEKICGRKQTKELRQDPGIENQVITLYPDVTYGELEGFGGAVTDSAAFVYSLMNETQRQELLTTYFTPERMNYGMLRVPMDSCDFSLDTYEAMTDPSDKLLSSFSMTRTEKYIFPMLNDIRQVSKRPLELMLSPWSPPAFMKTNGQRTQGGGLKPEYRTMWAEYLCRYIAEFRRRGYIVRRISLQNEPHAVQTWDSCLFTPQEQRDFLVDFMAPAMKRNGIADVEVFLWDHNKERVYEWMRDALDSQSTKLVAGAAFHWYSGDHFEALDLVRQCFPDKKLITSESCIEFYKFSQKEAIRGAMRLSHEILGDLNHGVCAFYDWNLVLDENGGPNHAGNFCLAPFLYDTGKKELVPQLIQRHIEHFSHYLVPGSTRIAHSRFSDDIEVTAWQRPDQKLVAIVLNTSHRAIPIFLRLEGNMAECKLPPQSITTAILDR